MKAFFGGLMDFVREFGVAAMTVVGGATFLALLAWSVAYEYRVQTACATTGGVYSTAQGCVKSVERIPFVMP